MGSLQVLRTSYSGIILVSFEFVLQNRMTKIKKIIKTKQKLQPDGGTPGSAHSSKEKKTVSYKRISVR